MPATLPPASGWAWRSLAGSIDPGIPGRHRSTAFSSRSTRRARARGRSASSSYGFWRGLVDETVASYLACGLWQGGFARVRCRKCPDEFLVAFSASVEECVPPVAPSGRSCLPPSSRTRSWSRWAMPSGGSPLPYVDEGAAEKLFRHKVLALLRRRGLPKAGQDDTEPTRRGRDIGRTVPRRPSAPVGGADPPRLRSRPPHLSSLRKRDARDRLHHTARTHRPHPRPPPQARQAPSPASALVPACGHPRLRSAPRAPSQAARNGRRVGPSSVPKPSRGLGRSLHPGARRSLAFPTAGEPVPEPQPGRPHTRCEPCRSAPRKGSSFPLYVGLK